MKTESSNNSAAEQLAFDAACGVVKTPQKKQRASLAPMLRQYLDLKSKYREHVLLFQVGDFFEVFFDDAKVVADTLNIRLTARHKDQPEPVDMCGVPVHAIDNYLPKLLDAGLSCVVVTQVETAERSSKGMVRREISRIVTPGVRYQGDGIDEKSFNFLAAVFLAPRGCGGCAFVDVSTGDLRVEEAESPEEMLDLLERIQPSEIILASTLDERPVEQDWRRKVRLHAKGTHLSIRPFRSSSRTLLKERLTPLLPTSSKLGPALDSLGAEALSAVEAVVDYVEEVSFGAVPRLSKIRHIQSQSNVSIDATTRRNLELTETSISGEKKNALVPRLDMTKTAMGSRLFRDWILFPLREIDAIEARHSAVAELLRAFEARSVIQTALESVRDIDRLVSRLCTNQANPRDIFSLGDSLSPLPQIASVLSACSSSLLQRISSEFDTLEDLHKLIDSALVEDSPAKIAEGGFIKEGYHPEADRLRDLRNNSKKLLLEIEEKERRATGISNLKVKFNNVVGYFIEVSKAHISKVPDRFERKQSLVGSERFIVEELKELEVEILSAKGRQLEIEKQLFTELKDRLRSEVDRIQRTSSLLSEIDVLCSFAEVADRHHYVMPTLVEEAETSIVGGRHPVVEQLVGSHSFVPNDLHLVSPGRNFAVLTGPNMGGKSTYLRQVGLIQVLAQAGAFVPAQTARLGLVDRIFTRIGGMDDLSRGDSTFMVEMREAASIVKVAGAKSLVLIDEIGRGTATTDGLAIARAIAEWLLTEVGCRTIFATHFHELNLLKDSFDSVFCLSVGVAERAEGIEFTHRIEERAGDRSYGIEVARRAGLPERLLQRASALLAQIEDKPVAPPLTVEVVRQPEVSRPGEKALVDRLRDMDANIMTPVEALVLLEELCVAARETSEVD